MPGLGFDLFEFAARTVRDHAAALLGAVREREPRAIDGRGLHHSPADAAPVLRLVPQQADAPSRSHTAPGDAA